MSAIVGAIPRKTFALLVFAALGIALFAALGTWQVQRRAWKLDLIARVEQRVHAAPVAAPGPAEWPPWRGADHEYRRVRVSGVYIASAQALVQAVTERGPGHWLLVPLRQADGSVVWINRGFVPSGWRAPPAAAPAAPVVVDGLLRLTEPGGGFLRRNDPVADRWYSRDVQALGAARGLTRVAPFFIDADALPQPAPGEPVGGLTVIAFPNNHAVYAITWYTLALMVAAAAFHVLRAERRPRVASVAVDDEGR